MSVGERRGLSLLSRVHKVVTLTRFRVVRTDRGAKVYEDGLTLSLRFMNYHTIQVKSGKSKGKKITEKRNQGKNGKETQSKTKAIMTCKTQLAPH